MTIFQQLNPAETPIIILSEGCFGELQSKTATGVIRYGKWPVLAVIDSRLAGKTAQEIMPLPPKKALQKDIPILASLEEALAMQPKALLLGTAPAGGKLPDTWRDMIFQAIESGLHIINGLHFFLNSDSEMAARAQEKQVILWDVRNPDHYILPDWHPVALQLPRPAQSRVITFVGSDCSVGKMHAALAVNQEVNQQGQKSSFLATGQTGILIAGNGLPLDRVIGDFMAGYVESSLLGIISQEKPDWVFVEGQGSLLHPGFSSVTLALMHGSNPDGLILCHRPGLTKIRGDYQVPIPPLSRLVQIYEEAVGWTHLPHQNPCRVLGICLDTSHLPEQEARQVIQTTETETGLPTTDPVRFGAGSLIQAIFNLKQSEGLKR